MTTVEDWIQLIRSEYFEIPDLHLTKKQVQRLWNLDAVMCDALLDSLLEAKFLKRTSDGAFARSDGGAR